MNRVALLTIAVLLAGGAALDVLTGSKNPPGYSAAIGLLGGIAIILISKLASNVLSRPEGLYPDDALSGGEQGGHDD